jgi:hypothetical protein
MGAKVILAFPSDITIHNIDASHVLYSQVKGITGRLLVVPNDATT